MAVAPGGTLYLSRGNGSGGRGDVDVPALVARLRVSGLPEQVRVDVEPAHGLRPDPRTGKFHRVITHVKAGPGAAFPDGVA